MIFFAAWKFNYIFFHSALEGMVCLVSLGLTMMVWNARKILRNNFLVFLGIAFFSVGILNFFHIVSFPGMPVFTEYGPSLASQLWISERVILALSLVIAFLFINKRLNEYLVLGIYMAATILALVSIYEWKIFPQTYITGVGLTTFKVYAEYIISILFVVSAALLYKYREYVDPETYWLLLLSIFFNVIAELLFSGYKLPTQFVTMLAHVCIFYSYYFVYKAIIVIGLNKPYQLLFSEIQEINRQKDELLHVASHELKNPVTSIKAYSQLLTRQVAKGDNGVNLKHMLDQIQSQTERISRILNDISDVGRIETGKFVLEKSQIEINDLVEDIVESFRSTEPDRVFKVQVPKGAIKTECDKNRISQVLVNLIANAVKYSPSGSSIEVKISKQKGNVVISVKDEGIGIEKIKLPFIFNKYYRTESGEKKAEGLGLGLYICKQIIEQHRGKIWVTSHADNGSTFYFSLPKERRNKDINLWEMFGYQKEAVNQEAVISKN